MLVLYYLCYLLNNKIHLIYKELIVWLLNISISFALHLLTNTEKGTQLNQWQFQIYKMRMPLIADACFVLLDLSYHGENASFNMDSLPNKNFKKKF